MPVSLPMNTLKGNWSRLHNTERLRRSSHVVSVIDQTVCIFGGEVQPRQPIDDQIDILSLQSGTHLTYITPHQPTTVLTNSRHTKPRNKIRLRSPESPRWNRLRSSQWQNVHLLRSWRGRYGAHRRGRRRVGLRPYQFIMGKDHASRLIETTPAGTQLPLFCQRRPGHSLHSCRMPCFRPPL
jgi:hypothetical protein